MKCNTCDNWMSELDRCKFCHYEPLKHKFLKWDGESYRAKSIEISSDGMTLNIEWERVE